jgi:hypothetical protein
MSNTCSISTWPYESKIYAEIAAEGMRGKRHLERKNIQLGDGHRMDFAMTAPSGAVLSLHQPFDPLTMQLRIHFQSSNEEFYRVDTNHGYVHYHLQSGTRTFEEQVPILGSFTVANLISYVFEYYEETLKWKLPNTTIIPGSGFVGFA